MLDRYARSFSDFFNGWHVPSLYTGFLTQLPTTNPAACGIALIFQQTPTLSKASIILSIVIIEETTCGFL